MSVRYFIACCLSLLTTNVILIIYPLVPSGNEGPAAPQALNSTAIANVPLDFYSPSLLAIIAGTAWSRYHPNISINTNHIIYSLPIYP